MKKERNKNRNKIIIPLFETNPIAKSGEDEKTIEYAVKLAKEWVEENKL